MVAIPYGKTKDDVQAHPSVPTGKILPPEGQDDRGLEAMIKALFDEEVRASTKAPWADMEDLEEGLKPHKYYWDGQEPQKPRTWLVHRLIPEGRHITVFAPPKSGKSTWVVHMACCVATGTPFHTSEGDRRSKKGWVLYVAEEDPIGIEERRKAWKMAHGIKEQVDIAIMSDGTDLSDPASVERISLALSEMAAEKGEPCSLVVFDTMGACSPGIDENSSKEITVLFQGLKRLRVENPGMCTCLVTHTGHADQSRAKGSITISGSTDQEFSVSGNGETLKITQTKNKSGRLYDPWCYRFKQIPIEIDEEDGEPVWMPVLVPTDEDMSQRVAKRSKGAERGLKAWREAAEEYGLLDDNGDFLGVHNDAFGEVMKSLSTASNLKAKNTEFSRAKKELTDHNWLVVCDDIYRLGPAMEQGEAEMNLIAERLRAKRQLPQEEVQEVNSEEGFCLEIVENDS